jgi:UDP-N-acetylmuramate--alanine ligase
MVVYSSAIGPDHLELKSARQNKMKVYHRAEILSSLFNRAKTSVAIAGSHGKTTTSSMISYVLSELGKNPTCLIGGDMLNLKTNAILGDSDLWVSEVDESDRTHQLYAPNYAVLTNLEEDHMDQYKNFEDLNHSFARFLGNMHDPGFAVYFEEDKALRKLIRASGLPRVSFGFTPRADYCGDNIELPAMGSEFDLMENGFFVTRVKLCVPGRHNIANALAATALLIQLGISPEECAEVLAGFRGASRRLEVKFENSDFQVIDDYGHHPTELSASIRALKSSGKPVTVIFQPHRFSRTHHFYKEFASALLEADKVVLTDIYGAGEKNTYNVSIHSIYREMLKTGFEPVFVMPKTEIVSHFLQRLDGLKGTLAFVGAGDIGDIAHEFADRVKDFATA